MLLELPHPKYQEVQNKCVHLNDLQINGHDPKNELPIHVIRDYTKIKTHERPRVGLPGEPIAN